MAVGIDVTVRLRGGLFWKNIPKVVQRQLVAEVLTKLEQRTQRQGKGLGARKNTVTHSMDGLTLKLATTRIAPRTTGKSHQRKNIGVVRAMAPRVMKKAAERIAAEMGT